MDARECYVYREEACPQCGGGRIVLGGARQRLGRGDELHLVSDLQLLQRHGAY